MDPIGIVVLLVAGLGIVALIVRRGHSRSQDTAEIQLRGTLHQADLRIQCEHQQARRAMNDAAGQSWRNLTG